MPRQKSTVEFKTFIKGIITEVSPLTFPENASIDEQNFVINSDGSRDRRLGLDFEDNFVKYSLSDGVDSATNSFRWIDGKGTGEGDIVVVQWGKSLLFFDASNTSITASLIQSPVDLSRTASGSVQAVSRASFTRLGKYLVVSSGGTEIATFTYGGNALTRAGYRLKIRDYFGVDDFDTDGTDLTTASGLSRRPSVKTDNHIYNLRNQSWGRKFTSKATGAYADPLASWKGLYAEYPANSDVVIRGLAADTTDDSNRTVERFWEKNLHDTDYGSGEPPRGAFIIDFLDRSASRLAELAKVTSEKGLSFPVSSLPTEYETATARACSAYSGRIFYGGFAGSYSENSKSPSTESFVLFSQLINSGNEFGKCYQTGDPTSSLEADLLATDGGFIQLEDAYGIHTLLTLSEGLLVMATNGVWLISGGSDYGFSADNYRVRRISDKLSISPDSVVKVDDTVLFWGEEGIFQIAANNYGELVATNITQNTIQTLYDDIPLKAKVYCQGLYDPYEAKIRWVYGEREDVSTEVGELVLDTKIGAFSKNIYPVYQGHYVIAPVAVPPYSITQDRSNVTAGGVTVTAATEDVFTLDPVRDTGLRGIRYLVADRTGANTSDITLSYLTDSSFRDWLSVDNVGQDAHAYMLTGYYGADDVMRHKQVSKLLTYLRRSETGFKEDASGDWTTTNPSSCLVSAYWGWTDSAVAGKWSKPVQTYRLKRQYFPASVTDTYDDGHPVVITQNKLRGRGRVLSLKIESEANKDLQLLGWAMVIGVDGAA